MVRNVPMVLIEPKNGSLRRIVRVKSPRRNVRGDGRVVLWYDVRRCIRRYIRRYIRGFMKGFIRG